MYYCTECDNPHNSQAAADICATQDQVADREARRRKPHHIPNIIRSTD